MLPVSGAANPVTTAIDRDDALQVVVSVAGQDSPPVTIAVR